MSDKVQYLFTNETNDGALVFRSTVQSFGLDHVTDKDLYSFFIEFSSRSYFDSGLLPVEGSGVLSIRRALHHTQVAYQHAPSAYYVNWGAHEGDSGATKYLVAQPYRIVIIDFLNDNIYGARTFYSPAPITYPDAPLYHVNLPNINCRGYRGNGVGWICLYHTEDLTSFPFSERLVKALERCSGVETYNDANMSETDGTRFYREHRPEQEFLWSPAAWEAKTSQEGWEWTLNPDLWIPVLVQDWDHQGAHDPHGQPLTFVDALFGNYQAYYTDTLIPKPVNAIARRDQTLDYKQLFNEFKTTFMQASTSTIPFAGVNVFEKANEIKNKLSESATAFNISNNDDDDNDDEQSSYSSVTCLHCDNTETYSDWDGPQEMEYVDYDCDYVCSECIETRYIYDEVHGEYFPIGSIEADEVLSDFHRSPSFCFRLHDPHETHTASLVHGCFNDAELQAKIQAMYSLVNQDYYHGQMLKWELVPLIGEEIVTDDVLTVASRLPEGKSLCLFNEQNLKKPYITPVGCGLRLVMSAMCAHCADEMFSSPEKFIEFWKMLQDYFSNGIGNIKNFEAQPTDTQQGVLQLLSVHHVHSYLFHT